MFGYFLFKQRLLSGGQLSKCTKVAGSFYASFHAKLFFVIQVWYTVGKLKSSRLIFCKQNLNMFTNKNVAICFLNGTKI